MEDTDPDKLVDRMCENPRCNKGTDGKPAYFQVPNRSNRVYCSEFCRQTSLHIQFVEDKERRRTPKLTLGNTNPAEIEVKIPNIKKSIKLVQMCRTCFAKQFSGDDYPNEKFSRMPIDTEIRGKKIRTHLILVGTYYGECPHCHTVIPTKDTLPNMGIYRPDRNPDKVEITDFDDDQKTAIQNVFKQIHTKFYKIQEKKE